MGQKRRAHTGTPVDVNITAALQPMKIVRLYTQQLNPIN